jgi:hypothetical protein
MAETETSEDDPPRKEFDDTFLKPFRRDRDEAAMEKVAEDGLQKRREKFKKILEKDTDFYFLFHCAGIAATWLSFLSVSLFYEMSDGEERTPLDEQVAALAFFSRLANDLWAIIEMVEFGFDLQARALTRSYLEHVDVLICCIQDRELTREFVKAMEPEEANAFWHKHVSKNRAKAKVTKFIAGILGRDTVTMVDVLREDAEFAGSSLIHPTVTAGLATAFGDPDGNYEDSYPIFPNPVPASKGILRTILIHLFWLKFATGGQPNTWSGQWRPLLSTQELRNGRELRRLSRLYTDIFQFLMDNQLLMKSTEDDPDIKE